MKNNGIWEPHKKVMVMRVLDTYRKDRGISFYRIAKDTGMSKTSVKEFFCGDRDISWDRYCAILDALGLSYLPIEVHYLKVKHDIANREAANRNK